jgi:hypothetical protein
MSCERSDAWRAQQLGLVLFCDAWSSASSSRPRDFPVTGRADALARSGVRSVSRTGRPEPVADHSIDSLWVFELEEMADARQSFGLGARR